MKTIASLTDDQLIEIADIVFGVSRFSGNVDIQRGDDYINISFGPSMNHHYLGISDKLNIVADINGENAFENQYKIFQLLQQWEIQPV